MYKKLLLLIMIVFFFIGWSTNPKVNTPICTASGSQYYSRIAIDGYGGAILTWQDNRAGNYDIYAQLVDSTGKIQWPYQGVAVCKAAGDQMEPRIITDGSGGAIIVWKDDRGSDTDIYAQRVDSKGKIKWAPGGVAVCTAAGDQRFPRIIYDQSGGVIISWSDKRQGSDWDIYVQHIDSSGKVTWTQDGIFIATVENTYNAPQLYHAITTDSSEGAILTWQDRHRTDSDIRTQRVSANGTLLWTADGIPVCTAGGEQYAPQLTSDGLGGAIIAWIDERDYDSNGQRDIYAQRVNANGTELWAAHGMPVYLDWSFVYLYNIEIISDRKKGAILAWECAIHDSYYQVTYSEARCQRIDSSGNVLWNAGGVLLSTQGEGKNPTITSNGPGGAIFAWQDERTNYEDDIYAQFIDAAGTRRWGTEGVAICTKNGTQSSAGLVSDKAGGAVITWSSYSGDIYAQNVCESGALGNCNNPVAVIEADKFSGIIPVMIKFDAGNSFSPNGTIIRWEWDFGDGRSSVQKKVNHTYDKPGTYKVTLRVKDSNGRWSAAVEKTVRTYAPGAIEVEMTLEPKYVKSDGKGLAKIYAVCHEKLTGTNKKYIALSQKPANPNASLAIPSGKTIMGDLGLYFTTTSGILQKEVIFDPSTGYYFQVLRSGAAGTAKVSAVVDGYELATGTVEFAWPRPPVNLQVELKVNRSLFMGEYHAYLSWSENPDEVFTPEKYRVYRSTNGGAFELVGEVDASTFTCVDSSLPAGNSYRYAVSMVDSEGDESLHVTGTNQ